MEIYNKLDSKNIYENIMIFGNNKKQSEFFYGNVSPMYRYLEKKGY